MFPWIPNPSKPWGWMDQRLCRDTLPNGELRVDSLLFSIGGCHMKVFFIKRSGMDTTTYEPFHEVFILGFIGCPSDSCQGYNEADYLMEAQKAILWYDRNNDSLLFGNSSKYSQINGKYIDLYINKPTCWHTSEFQNISGCNLVRPCPNLPKPCCKVKYRDIIRKHDTLAVVTNLTLIPIIDNTTCYLQPLDTCKNRCNIYVPIGYHIVRPIPILTSISSQKFLNQNNTYLNFLADKLNIFNLEFLSDISHIYIFDIYGNIIIQKPYNMQISSNFISIPIGDLINGIYFVKISSTNGDYYIGKVIVIN